MEGTVVNGGQWVFDGSISGYHWEVDRRPYHRNCGCALHKNENSVGKTHRRNPSAAAGICTAAAVSFPVRRSKSHGCLALAATTTTISPSDLRSSKSRSRSSSSNCLWEMEMEMDREED